MIRLRTLGSFDLESAGGEDLTGVVAQPKRAALLLYLALARPSGFQRRDRLLALLWPELDDQRGRTALRQAVYRLRQAMGRELVVSRGDDELRLAEGEVRCDAVEFETLLDAGRIAEALALYRGDFLPGFHVDGASEEWESWVEAQRSRLRLRARDGCGQLAREEERRGNGVGAATWARRAAELVPDEEEATRALVALLFRLGDRSGALRCGTEFARRHRELYGGEPSTTFLALLEEARRNTPAPASEPAPVLPSAADPESSPATLATPAAAAVPVRVTPSRRLRVWGVGLAIGLLGVTAFVWWRATGPAGPALVAVGEIRDVSVGAERVPVAVLRDLLATGLAQVPTLEVISGPRLVELEVQLGTGRKDPTLSYRAARLAGATLLLDGDVRRDGDSLRLSLRATDLGRGAIRYSVQAVGANLFALADVATARVADRSGVPAPTVHVGDLSTRSETAYRFYQEGLRAYYAADFISARRLFGAALQEDSDFAMAWLYAAKTDWGTQRSPPMLAEAARRAVHAGERERLTIMAHWAMASLDPAALAYADTLTSRYPAEPASLMLLAQTRLNSGDPVGAIAAARQVLELDPLGASGLGATCYACDAFMTLIGGYADQNRILESEAAAREYLARQPHSILAMNGLHDVLIRLDRFASADSLRSALDTLMIRTPQGRWEPLLRRGEFAALAVDIEGSAARGTVDGRADARWWRTIILRTQGRLVAGQASAEADGGILYAQVLCERGQGVEGAARFETIANQALTPTPVRTMTSPTYNQAKHRVWYLTHAATCLALAGDTTRLASLADTIEAVGMQSSWPRDRRLHFYVRGLLARARGDWAGAVTSFKQATSSPVNGLTRNNYELAGALLQLGRPKEAIEPLQAALRGPLDAGGLYITRTEVEERLAEAFSALGARDSARAHYDYVVQAWAQADPPFRARWERARKGG